MLALHTTWVPARVVHSCCSRGIPCDGSASLGHALPRAPPVHPAGRRGHAGESRVVPRRLADAFQLSRAHRAEFTAIFHAVDTDRSGTQCLPPRCAARRGTYRPSARPQRCTVARRAASSVRSTPAGPTWRRRALPPPPLRERLTLIPHSRRRPPTHSGGGELCVCKARCRSRSSSGLAKRSIPLGQSRCGPARAIARAVAASSVPR